MHNHGQSKSSHCCGSLSRKTRHWPPPSAPAPSAAGGLRKRQAWQPQSWQKLQLICVLLSVLTFGTRPCAAQSAEETIGAGTLTFSGADDQSSEAPRLHTDVRIEVSGIIARVEVRQRFQNPGNRWVEGIYAFPLPENSAVDRLRMNIGERVIVGEIREKVAAQKLFEQAKASGQRASLVQQHRANLFRTSVANIGPHEVIEVTIGYLQIVDQQAGRYSLRFPLTITPRYLPGAPADSVRNVTAETPVATISSRSGTLSDTATLGDLQPPLAAADISRQSVSFDIDIDAGAPLNDVRSAYHKISMSRQQGRYAIRLADETVAPEHDFELAWTPAIHGEPAATLFREQTDAGEHVLLMFMPPQESARITTPREVIFVIDTSGSMGGESIAQARAALLNGLATLKPQDKFNIIQFNSYFEALFTETVPATAHDLDHARDYVRRLRSTGGTEMLPALTAAMGMPVSGEYLRQIVFITDGAVGNEDELMQLINDRMGDARLFTVGIGSAPNGAFMRKAAQMGRGTFTYIGSTSEVDAKMSGLLRKLERPVLTNIQLHWPAGVSPEYSPAHIGDLYAGEPIVVTARIQSPLHGTLGISGTAGSVWMRQLQLDHCATRSGVATLWARHRVGDLMDLRASHAEEDAIRSQVLPLALQYGLVTQYTSLVAVDQTPARPEGETLDTQRIANTKPQGSEWQAAALPKTATPATLQMLIGALVLLLALMLGANNWTRKARK
jgi:Ca-activated chloride channel family protein